MKDCKILSNNDSSYKDLTKILQKGGFIAFLCNPDGKVSPIHWQSQKICHVVKSTLAAECLALEESAETCFLIGSLLTELLHCEHKEIPIECVTDNQSLFETVYSTKNIQDKRLKVDIAILRNMPSAGEITKVKWIKSSLQLSNCLTKSGASTALLLKTLKFGTVQEHQIKKGSCVAMILETPRK